jgi:uncharacterized protein (UPF0332 family)
LTLADGDTIGASNRVYYALFDAVRAVLLARKLADLERIRTHHGISHVFTMSVVKAGLLDNEVALIFRKSLELRSDADYGSDIDLDREAVEAAVQQAATFIDACAKLVEGSAP